MTTHTLQTAPAPATRTDQQVPLQLKLAAAWTSFMCLYIYVDVLGLYKPGAVEGILKGKVFTFDITQTFMVSALAASAVPIMMILLSTTLPPRANRTTNLVVASLLIPWMAFNLTGGEWLYYYGLGFALELVILVFILRSAWNWRRMSAVSSLNE
ncbi:MAG: hypothetical protein IPL94_00235 [Tetrasphaera sp.]|nr:hypothetical protein [Tetrasphaera sp.]